MARSPGNGSGDGVEDMQRRFDRRRTTGKFIPPPSIQLSILSIYLSIYQSIANKHVQSNNVLINRA
jgi:hypothetical protein